MVGFGDALLYYILFNNVKIEIENNLIFSEKKNSCQKSVIGEKYVLQRPLYFQGGLTPLKHPDPLASWLALPLNLKVNFFINPAFKVSLWMCQYFIENYITLIVISGFSNKRPVCGLPWFKGAPVFGSELYIVLI